MPKEIQNPKSEWETEDARGQTGADYSTSWVWDSDNTNDLLREEPETTANKQNLMERTARFGEAIIQFAKRIPFSPVNNRLIDQLVGSGTSIGANYCEADDAVSGKDFKKSIGVCRKEAKECMYFLRMVATAEESLAEDARLLWREAKQLNLIFGALWRK